MSCNIYVCVYMYVCMYVCTYCCWLQNKLYVPLHTLYVLLFHFQDQVIGKALTFEWLHEITQGKMLTSDIYAIPQKE